MEELLIGVAKLSPVFVILISAIIWMKKKYEDKEIEIKELNSEIRDLTKDNLSVLYKTLSFFEKLEDSNQRNHEGVMKEIEELRKEVANKICSYERSGS